MQPTLIDGGRRRRPAGLSNRKATLTETPTNRPESTMNFRTVLSGIRFLRLCSIVLPLAACARLDAQGNPETRKLLAEAVLAPDDDAKKELVRRLGETGDDYVAVFFESWKRGEVFIHEAGGGERIPFILGNPAAAEPSPALRVADGSRLTGADGKPLSFLAKDLKPVDTNRSLRSEMKATTDFLALASPDKAVRLESAKTIGMARKPVNIEVLRRRLELEDIAGIQSDAMVNDPIIEVQNFDRRNLTVRNKVEVMVTVAQDDAVDAGATVDGIIFVG